MKWLLELETEKDPISICRLMNIFRRKGVNIVTLSGVRSNAYFQFPPPHRGCAPRDLLSTRACRRRLGRGKERLGGNNESSSPPAGIRFLVDYPYVASDKRSARGDRCEEESARRNHDGELSESRIEV